MNAEGNVYLRCDHIWSGPTYLQSLNIVQMGFLYDFLSEILGWRQVKQWKAISYSCLLIELPYGCSLDLLARYGLKLITRISLPRISNILIYETYAFPLIETPQLNRFTHSLNQSTPVMITNGSLSSSTSSVISNQECSDKKEITENSTNILKVT